METNLAELALKEAESLLRVEAQTLSLKMILALAFMRGYSESSRENAKAQERAA